MVEICESIVPAAPGLNCARKEPGVRIVTIAEAIKTDTKNILLCTIAFLLQNVFLWLPAILRPAGELTRTLLARHLNYSGL